MPVAHVVTPWLHVGLACAVLLLFIGASARAHDRESAFGLLAVGTMLLLCVAAEHGVLAYFRAR